MFIIQAYLSYERRTTIQVLQERIELLLKGSLRSCTHKLVNQLTTFEEQDSRDIANTEFHSNVIILLNITLTYYQLAVKLLSKF